VPMPVAPVDASIGAHNASEIATVEVMHRNRCGPTTAILARLGLTLKVTGALHQFGSVPLTDT
jgi:hypothetical protein